MFNTLELKEDKDTEYVTCWKPKGVYISKLIPLYTTFYTALYTPSLRKSALNIK